MISPHRIAEILSQCQKDSLLLAEGEYNAYTGFFMNLSEDVTGEKALVYIDSEIKRLEKFRDVDTTLYEEWQRATGEITGLNKIREAIKKYGE